MNADTAYAIWRTCYNGYETWLNTVPESPRTPRATPGAAWAAGSPGAGTTAGAQQYIAKVKQYKNERIWTTRDFQQP